MTAHPIDIRAFDEEDLEAVVEFSLRAWEPVFASIRSVLGDEVFLRLHPEWQESQAEAVRSSCTNPERDVFVAVVDDRRVAFVAVALNAFHERMGWIEIVGVDPAYQRRGISSQLTEYAVDHMRGHSMDIAVVGGAAGCSPVTLRIGDRVAARGVDVSANGTFRAPFTVVEDPGRYTVTVSQRAADGATLEDSAPLIVAVTDVEEEGPEVSLQVQLVGRSGHIRDLELDAGLRYRDVVRPFGGTEAGGSRVGKRPQAEVLRPL